MNKAIAKLDRPPPGSRPTKRSLRRFRRYAVAYEETDLIEDLKLLLQNRKKSLRSVSAEIGVPYRSMQNYFSGESRIPALLMVKILDYLGADIRYMRTRDDILSNADIYDAICEVLGDNIFYIDLSRPKRGEFDLNKSEVHRAKIETASELAIQLSEAYDKFSQSHMTLQPMLTIKEQRERRASHKQLAYKTKANDDEG
jgi:transcriptional regulator with XRE-family HTH domain